MQVLRAAAASLFVEQQGPHHAGEHFGKLGGNDLWHHLRKLHLHGLGLDEGAQAVQVDLLDDLRDGGKEDTSVTASQRGRGVSPRCRSARLRLPRAWRPSAWWGGRTSGNWPPNSSLWGGWPWSARGCTVVSSVRTHRGFWGPPEALRTRGESWRQTRCALWQARQFISHFIDATKPQRKHESTAGLLVLWLF